MKTILGLAVVLALFASNPLLAASWVQVVNLDSAGEGLNDPSPFTPAGSNPGTTLGEARLKAVELALAVWANQVASDVTIVAGVSFDPLGGTATSAVLGLGGPAVVHRDFAGAPRPATWYPSPLADKLAGVDLGSTGNPLDITLTFNSAVDGAVLGSSSFYYGFDGAAPDGDVELISVAAHEIAHALGFVTLVDRITGAKALGYDDAFMRHLEQHGATPADFPAMTDPQRQQAIVSGASLHWTGPSAVAAGAGLTAGTGEGGHLRMYGPSPVTSSSATHFDVSMSPDQLMEAFYTRHPLDLDLTHAALHDEGWNAAPVCAVVTIP